jgi:hypothetical protein
MSNLNTEVPIAVVEHCPKCQRRLLKTEDTVTIFDQFGRVVYKSRLFRCGTCRQSFATMRIEP